MNKRWLSLLSLAAIITVTPSFICREPKDLVYVKTDQVKLETVGKQESVLKMNVHYFNPNRFGMRLKEADCAVYMNDNYAGSFRLDTLIRIPNQDTFAIPIELKIDMGSILKHGLAILMNPDVKVRIDGSARLGRMGVSKKIPLNYEGIQRINL